MLGGKGCMLLSEYTLGRDQSKGSCISLHFVGGIILQNAQSVIV